MIDEIAIQQTLNRYTEGASRANWDQAASTYTPDGVWEVSSLGQKFQGRDTIRQTMIQLVEPMDYFVQSNAPAVIEVDGDRATARSVIQENGKFKGRNEGMQVLGVYEDNLVRTPEGWRFTRRYFHTISIVRVAYLAD